jgi:hypothetical protein
MLAFNGKRMKCDGRKAFVGVDGIATLVSVLSGKVNFQVKGFLNERENLKNLEGFIEKVQ